MTPEQETRVISALDTAALVIDGCAVRENDRGTKLRLYDEAKRLRDLSLEVTPLPIVVTEVVDL